MGAAKKGCFLCGTDGSNPSPSSGESGANLITNPIDDRRRCRPGGKSYIVAVRALHDLLFRENAMIIAASPTEEQSKELFRRIIGFYDRVPNAPRPTVRNTTELELEGAARFRAVSGRSAVNRPSRY
jgi:hypothetical protein